MGVGHRWYKGQPPANKTGRPRKGTSLAEKIRERADLDELFDIAMEIARGTPMVRVLDRVTGRPRLASEPSRERDVELGTERPNPVTMVGKDEVIHDVTWPGFEDRMKALTWIATMGGLKPPAELSVDVTRSEALGQPVDFSKLSDAELDSYVRLMEKATAEAEVIDVTPATPVLQLKP
jgi:hypothetical protein